MDGKELKQEREDLGFTITGMAIALNNTPRGTYVKWERDDRRVPQMMELAIKWLWSRKNKKK